jgi:hypothetical protein
MMKKNGNKAVKSFNVCLTLSVNDKELNARDVEDMVQRILNSYLEVHNGEGASDVYVYVEPDDSVDYFGDPDYMMGAE